MSQNQGQTIVSKMLELEMIVGQIRRKHYYESSNFSGSSSSSSLLPEVIKHMTIC